MTGPGITFRETMSGPFALGESVPETGAAVGRDANQTLAMHARVSIADIDRFVADPNHAGDLDGSVDLPALGQGLRADRGVFNLFSPGDAPDTRHMVYELRFTHDGADYYLAGQKTLRNDAGLDLLRDTTTLFTTLHNGRDKAAPIVGAGVLTLGAGDLMSLVSTIRVTNASDAGEGATALAKFGRFFLGELWQRYGPGLD